jgi:LmbE family N-acetylglucosaminyl deacetylase
MNTTLPPSEHALVVMAHPDDPEGLAGGTIAQLVARGTKVSYLILTGGDKRGDTSTRRTEQMAAATILGVSQVFFADFEDGHLENSPAVRLVIARYIRRLQPDLVITFDPDFTRAPRHGFYNHRDHRLAGAAACDAVYPDARNRAMFPELLEEGLEPHTVTRLLLVTLADDADCVFNISDQLDLKMKAMRAHTSQTGSPDQTGDEEKVRRWSESVGQAYGFEAAEAFVLLEIEI